MTRAQLTDEQIEERFFKKKGGRTATTRTAPAESPAILPEVEARIVAAQDQALSVTETNEVFAAGVDIGRLEALDFVATISTSALLSIFENVKKSKGWRLMRDPRSGDGRYFASLDEFCEIKLGKSYRRFRELAANRVVIGQEAFEQAERIGLRQVDYNAIKALPAPDQELVRRAVEDSKSRDDVLDLLQELAARHGQEKQALTKQVDELKAEADATSQLLADKNKALDKAKAAARRIANAPLEEQVAEELAEVNKRFHTALAYVRGDLRLGFQKLFERESAGDAEPGSHRQVMAGYVREIEHELAVLKSDFFLLDLPTQATE